MNKRSGHKRSGHKRSGHKRSMHKRSMHKRSGHKRTAKKERKGTHGYRKGSKSKTMKGKKDFTTKKTSKVFNRRRHYQKHAKGSRVVRKPYHKKRGGKLRGWDQLDALPPGRISRYQKRGGQGKLEHSEINEAYSHPTKFLSSKPASEHLRPPGTLGKSTTERVPAANDAVVVANSQVALTGNQRAALIEKINKDLAPYKPYQASDVSAKGNLFVTFGGKVADGAFLDQSGLNIDNRTKSLIENDANLRSTLANTINEYMNSLPGISGMNYHGSFEGWMKALK